MNAESFEDCDEYSSSPYGIFNEYSSSVDVLEDEFSSVDADGAVSPDFVDDESTTEDSSENSSPHEYPSKLFSSSPESIEANSPPSPVLPFPVIQSTPESSFSVISTPSTSESVSPVLSPIISTQPFPKFIFPPFLFPFRPTSSPPCILSHSSKWNHENPLFDCKQINSLCKNRECLEDRPHNSRAEYCSLVCKYRRGNYSKARLCICHDKLHARCVLERCIEMGVHGAEFEARRAELRTMIASMGGNPRMGARAGKARGSNGAGTDALKGGHMGTGTGRGGVGGKGGSGSGGRCSMGSVCASRGGWPRQQQQQHARNSGNGKENTVNANAVQNVGGKSKGNEYAKVKGPNLSASAFPSFFTMNLVEK